MVDRLLGAADGLIRRTGRGVAAFLAIAAALAAATGLAMRFGVHGLAGVLGVLALFYGAGIAGEGVDRRRRRKEAFLRRDSPEKTLDPIEDCRVHPCIGQEDGTVPEFVERGEWELLQAGLTKKRFIVITGKGICGKSRLAYEACARLSQITLVALDPPVPGEDPLRILMEDERGFPAVEDHQILLLNNIARRLRSGCLNRRRVRTWLDQNPNISIVAVMTDQDEKELEEGGASLKGDLNELLQEAESVTVRPTLDQVERGRAKKVFPHLEDRDLENLPHYLASGPRLHEAVERARRGGNDLALAIVRVVVDWHRTGITLPVSLDFLREHALRLARNKNLADFNRELAWALAPVGGDAAVIYERPIPGDRGFVPDSSMIEIFDHPTLGDGVHGIIWINALNALRRMARAGDYSNEEIALQLFFFGKAAFRAGEEATGKRAFAYASGLSSDVQSRIGEFVVTDRGSTLVKSRRGDGVFQRLQPVEQLATGWRKHRGDRRRPFVGGPVKALGWIYRRHWLRSITRLAFLTASDLASVAFGLFIGLEVRAWLSHSKGAIETAHSSPYAGIALAVAAVLFVFGWASLYKRDATRARIGAIASAVSLLAAFTWVVAAATGDNVFVAGAATICGGLVCLAADVVFREIYDLVSRGWVIRNSLEARTLLIGRPCAVAEIEEALKAFSRPMDIIGYLEDQPNPDGQETVPSCPRLGKIDDLGDAAEKHAIGRVILADADLDIDQRQRIADRCHERRLIVEARASLSDIRAGISGFVLGQPVVLIPLWPLWPRNIWMIAKRLLDIGLSLFALAFLWLPMLIIAICIRVQGRPVIVRALRLGLGGEHFYMLRFRTSKNDVGGIDILEPEPSDSVERIWLGTVLHRSGVDELPQLFNILRGHMSLVGPRPLELRHHLYLDELQLQRYLVRPGATGPWQVCRRTTLTYEELTSLDLAYIRHWSIFTDFEILARTFLLIFTRRQVPMIAGRDEELERGLTREASA